MILTALCGHGHLDLAAYDDYLSGTITDHPWDDEELQSAVNRALDKLPAIPMSNRLRARHAPLHVRGRRCAASPPRPSLSPTCG